MIDASGDIININTRNIASVNEEKAREILKKTYYDIVCDFKKNGFQH